MPSQMVCNIIDIATVDPGNVWFVTVSLSMFLLLSVPEARGLRTCTLFLPSDDRLKRSVHVINRYVISLERERRLGGGGGGDERLQTPRSGSLQVCSSALQTNKHIATSTQIPKRRQAYLPPITAEAANSAELELQYTLSTPKSLASAAQPLDILASQSPS